MQSDGRFAVTQPPPKFATLASMVTRTLTFGMLAAGMALASIGYGQAHFTQDEKAKIKSYWLEEGRYQVLPLPDASTAGSWRARQTALGSTWLLNYYKSRAGAAKVNPKQPPAAQNDQQRAWDLWINRRYDRDVYVAELEARRRNNEEVGREIPGKLPKMATDPGPVPADLEAAFGEPPVFYVALRPRHHVICFHDQLRLAYIDNIATSIKYPYFRFHDGVMSGGKKVRTIPSSELNSLFRLAGINASEAKVFAAVSLLEGGFDSLNTYDTGFVSVGFLQFASLTAGGGSLGRVLLRQKQWFPTEFDRDFRKFGLDVTVLGQLVALDPETGIEGVGPEANGRIIVDKRLASVFQRAGQISTPFKVCQLAIAKESYYPSELEIKVMDGSKMMVGKVKDVFRTEAGIATLMDRKVNTGNLGDLNNRVAQVMNYYGFNTIAEAAKAEYQLIRMLKYREDYLKDPNLTKPRDNSSSMSRRGGRNDRRKGKS